jgi:hypothetical protein
MTTPYDLIHNHHEQAVFSAVKSFGPAFPHLAEDDILADIACVALNRIPPRYIRHGVDLAFYLSDKERADNERLVSEAVGFAFEFVQARIAMRARG